VDEVTERVGGVVAAFAGFVVGIDFQDILGAERIVLESRQAGDETGTAGMDKESGRDFGVEIAQSAQYFGPAIDAVGVGAPEVQAMALIFVGDRGAIIVQRENILAGDDFAEARGREIEALEEFVDGFGVAFSNPLRLAMLGQDMDDVVTVTSGEEKDGGMSEAIVESAPPLDGALLIKIALDMDIAAEVGEELAGGDVPIAIEPGALLPTGEFGEAVAVFAVEEAVMTDARRDEESAARAGVRIDEEFFVPLMADPAGIGGGVNAGAPGGAGTSAASGDMAIFAFGKGGGFLDADDVVFEAEILIDVLFGLEMAEDDFAAIGKGEHAAMGLVIVRQAGEELLAKALEMFDVGLAYFAEEQASQAGSALAIVGGHLCDEPMTFAAAAGSAEANRTQAGGGMVAAARRGAGQKLLRLENDAGAEEVLHLVPRAAGVVAGAEVAERGGIGSFHGVKSDMGEKQSREK